MKLGALLGWGIAIYSVMFTLWSLLALYGFGASALSRGLLLAALLCLALAAGRSLRMKRAADLFPYSIAWTIAVIALDGLFSYPISGLAVYANWSVWIGYAIVLFAPVAQVWLPAGGAQLRS